jgi:hypothetical protein
MPSKFACGQSDLPGCGPRPTLQNVHGYLVVRYLPAGPTLGGLFFTMPPLTRKSGTVVLAVALVRTKRELIRINNKRTFRETRTNGIKAFQ